ncbi:MAG: DUF819 family protein [Planctomycetota bacterium]
MFDSPLAIVAVLGLNVLISEWLVRRTVLRHFGTALLVIVVTAVCANVGMIPTGALGSPVYSGVFTYLAPLSIFWLLLPIRLKDVARAGGPMITLFLIGSLGTMLGVWLGMTLVDGAESIGPQHAALGGMFTGTYIGGSVNFNALAIEYDVQEDGLLYTAAVAVDNIWTAVWMVATIAIPRLFARRRVTAKDAKPDLGIEDDTETLHPADIGMLLALGAGAIAFSEMAAGWIERSFDFGVPSILITTTIALIAAQIPAVQKIAGCRLLGMFAVYVFLAVIGAYCDIGELARIGDLGVTLFLFAGTIVIVHGAVTFGGAKILRQPMSLAAVASQANIGGGTSALALARSLGRSDLVLPAILIGSLGTALGNYLGFLVAGILGG